MPTPAKANSRRSSPAQNSVLNSVRKTLVSAVGGGRNLEESPAPVSRPRNVEPVSVASEVAAATGAAPIGAGVDYSMSQNRNIVQAAQPVPGVGGEMPQQMMMPQMAMVPMQVPYMVPVYAGPQPQVPLPMGAARPVNYAAQMPAACPPGAAAGGMGGAPQPMYMPGSGVGIAPARYDHPTMPGYAWPSYAAYPNYAAVTYPKQYSPTAWPYIGPFYPYPQVPLGWRKVTLEWDDGWWMLDFKDRRTMYNH
jgi:hypothetical protein